MKSLRNILEGIFDIEDNIANDQHLDELMFKDPDSDFWKFVNVKNTDAERLLQYEQAVIDLDRDSITLFKDIELRTNKNPLSTPYDLEAASISIGDRNGSGPHPDKISNNAGFKNLLSLRFYIDGMCGELKNCKFNVVERNPWRNMSGGSVKIYWGDQLKFNNVEFDFENTSLNSGYLLFNNLTGIPDLHGLKSNVQSMSLYSPGFFDYDDTKKKLEKFFGKGTFETYGGDTKNKTLRNIVAVANNPSKYKCINPATIAPEGTVEELFGSLKGFKDLKLISLSNNNVEIKFQKSLPFAWVKYLQVMSREAAKIPTAELSDRFKKTADGWYVTVMKKYI